MATFSNKLLLSKLQKQQTQFKSISSITINVQNVHLCLHELADGSWNSRSTCRLRLAVNRLKSSQALTCCRFRSNVHVADGGHLEHLF